MKLNLLKVTNARTLCGLKTKYGVIKKDVFIRTGEHSLLCEQDAKILREHNLKRIIDLRTSKEMENNPDIKIDGVEYVNISIIRATTFGISYERLDGKTIAEMLEAGFVRMQNRNETYSEHMEILYRNFVRDEHCRSKYGEFLRLLAERPACGSTLWHCSMGKDRVGTCTALLLYCLGASMQDIYDDYMLTNTLTRQNTESNLYKVAPYVSPDKLEIVQDMLMVKQEYLQSFFDEINCKYKTVENFLLDCGVTEQHINKLRKNYLE